MKRVLVLSALSLCAGCDSTRSAVWNLDHLMGQEGDLRHLAPMRNGLEQLAHEFAPRSVTDEEVPVPDPSVETLEQLLVLAERDPSSLRDRLQRTRVLCSYAARCVGRLARERAVIELGILARSRGLTVLERPPAEPASPGAIAEAFASLKSELASGSGSSESLGALAALPLDLESTLRLMGAIAVLVQTTDIAQEDEQGILELGLFLELHGTSLALAEACVDADPHVRAAAYEACAGAFEDEFLLEALDGLNPPRLDAQGRVILSRGFQLRPTLPRETLVIERVLDLAARRGPDLFRARGDENARALRMGILRLLVTISHEAAQYEDRARAAAVRALVALSGTGPDSRRKEDWERWWRQEVAREREASPTEAREPKVEG